MGFNSGFKELKVLVFKNKRVAALESSLYPFRSTREDLTL